ncbi:MAG: DNA phosphorothioation-associated protein 4 [Cyanobacteriota bacterium]|nr:DNA phosphorothioation-associated protein 4 [Cyanobacteriota bacterium]
MEMNRVRIAKNKTELVKGLTQGDGNTGPFQTYADVMVFAAALGIKRKKRVPLEEVAKRDPSPIGIEVFWSRGYDSVIKLVAIADTKDINILSPTDTKAEATRIEIFEEYANGGLEVLEDELRGSVDYAERILLMLMSERHQKPQPEEEFDLSRFLG